MSFFNQFQRGVDVAKFKAHQLNRINKLQTDIANLAGDIQNVRKQIVDTTIRFHSSNIELPDQLNEFCKKILQLDDEIKNVEQKINKIRSEEYSPSTITEQKVDVANEIKCPHCTKNIPDDSEFCIHCGKQIK